MARAPAGDYVVRESARTPGAFVLMLKLTAVTGIQKRILWDQGVYRIDGGMETYETINDLLSGEPMAQRPAKNLILAVSQPLSAAGGTSKKKSGREFLEQAMNLAEAGQGAQAMQCIDAALQVGVSERNARVTREYVQSFMPVQEDAASPIAPSGGGGGGVPSGGGGGGAVASATDTLNNGAAIEVDGFGNLLLNVNVRKNEDSSRLDIVGIASCEITAEAKLILEPSKGGKKHVWPLGYLRKYGRDAAVFYFESGRRCPSGPATIYLETTHGEKMFQLVDKAVKEVIQAAQDMEQQKAEILANLRAEKKQKEIIENMQRNAAIAKHSAFAMVEARMRMKAAEARARRLKKKRDAEELKKEQQREDEDKDRLEKLRRQKESNAEREKRASQLADVSDNTKSKMGVKEKNSGMFAAAPEWGAGKSKIWKALNPEPLAHQTAADRRDKSQKQEMGMVGNRNYSMINQMTGADNIEETAGEPSAMGEGVNDLADMSDDELELDDDDDEEEEDVDYNDADLTMDASFSNQLDANRAKREAEEKARREALQKKHKEDQAKLQDGRNKELAVWRRFCFCLRSVLLNNRLEAQLQPCSCLCHGCLELCSVAGVCVLDSHASLARAPYFLSVHR